MPRKFGDLQKGDTIFLMSSGWKIYAIRVLEVYPHCDNTLTLELNNAAWTGIYGKDKVSNPGKEVWSDYEEMLGHYLEKAKQESRHLEKKIDDFIFVYDQIEEFMKKYERC